MGTSAMYKGLTGDPNWSSLSSQVTKSCNSATPNSHKKTMQSFAIFTRIQQRSGKSYGGAAGIRTAHKLRNVITSIRNNGLSGALAAIDYNVENPSTDSIINFLIEYCCGPAATLDESAAKNAEKKLLEEICLDANTLEELDLKFTEVLELYTDQEILVKYFSYYLLEHLSEDFYEALVKKKGKENAGDLFIRIKEYIDECVKTVAERKNLNDIRWNEAEGSAIEQNIYNETLNAFADYEF